MCGAGRRRANVGVRQDSSSSMMRDESFSILPNYRDRMSGGDQVSRFNNRLHAMDFI